MDGRAEIRGMDELKHARDVLQRLNVAIDGMPAGVKRHDRPDAADTQSKLLHALVRDGWRELMRELKAAWTAATALPERATLRFKQPAADGSIRECEWEYQPRVNDWQGPEALESLLAALPDELAAWDKALELARELESAAAKLKDEYGQTPHIGIMFNSYGGGTGWHDFDHWVCRTQKALVDAFSPLAEAADCAWRSIKSGVAGECVWTGKGWTSIESAWAKVPLPAPAAPPQPLSIVIGESVRRNTTIVVMSDGKPRPCNVPDQFAEFLLDLARDGTARIDRSVKSRLIAKIPELDGLIQEADWPQGVAREHNEACYHLDDAVRSRVTKAEVPTK